MLLLDLIVLWIHLFFAIIFIGGSFFIWFVVWPASYDVTDDEKLRTKVVGKIAKRFAYFTHVSLVLLVITGLYNVTWYLPSAGNLFTTMAGKLLFTKALLVLVVIVMIYVNNLYHGKKIMKLSEDGKYSEMRRIRKRTHLFSYASLGILLVITILAAAMQFYG
ncbi:hypothetical protein IX51_05135 [uncultured archaeon]|nr:hypothetical protein IX51_05135 [uncultured archaeon]